MGENRMRENRVRESEKYFVRDRDRQRDKDREKTYLE